MGIYGPLENLSPVQHQALWGSQEYYRVFSLVNGGRNQETDLFEGLRDQTERKYIEEEGKDDGNA